MTLAADGFCVMLIVLLVLTGLYHVTPSIRLLALPFFLFLATLTATGIVLWFSALSVKYRDFIYALPFLIHVWMYATSAVYLARIVPAKWQTWFALNPAAETLKSEQAQILKAKIDKGK